MITGCWIAIWTKTHQLKGHWTEFVYACKRQPGDDWAGFIKPEPIPIPVGRQKTYPKPNDVFTHAKTGLQT